MTGLILTLLVAKTALFGNVVSCPRCHQTYQTTTRLSKDTMIHIVQKAMPRVGYTPSRSGEHSMLRLTWKESTWNPRAQNSKSTSATLNGFLNSTWKSVGIKKTNCPYCQVEAMLRYIKARYKTPERAYRFHSRRNYY